MTNKELLDPFREVKEVLKKIEVYTGKFFLPANNELRYATKHLLEGIIAKDQDARDEAFKKYKRHLTRVKYDVIDYGIVFYETRILALYDYYYKDLSLANSAIDSFQETIVEFEKIKEERKNIYKTHYSNREEYFLKIKSFFQPIKDIYTKLNSVRVLFEEELREKNTFSNKLWSSNWFRWVMRILGTVGVYSLVRIIF